MDVRLEDGTLVRNVPEGTTRSELMRRVGKLGNAQPQQQETPASIFAKTEVPHTGYRAQVQAAFTGPGPEKIQPKSVGELARNYGDIGIGVAEGIPSGIAGLPGDVESTGRFIGKPVGVSQETVLPTSEDVGNALFGKAPNAYVAAGRAGGNFIAPAAAANVVRGARLLANPLVAGEGPTAAAQAAHQAGYVLPPAMASNRPGVVSNVLSGVSGKQKLQQAASIQNQVNTNRLAAQSLGLPANTPLSERVLNAVRYGAGRAYRDVARVVPQVAPDAAFQRTIGRLGGRQSAAAQAFPGLVHNAEIDNLATTLQNTQSFTPQEGLDLVRQLRHDASANLRAFDNPHQQSLGLAQREAADAVDDLIERRAAAAGQPDVVNRYRAARTRIARSYDVRAALNQGNGDVSARMLAALRRRGRRLGGPLQDVANAAEAFPPAMQNPAGIGGVERLGILDLAAAAATQGATVPLSLARPSARTVMLSPTYQNLLMGTHVQNPNSYVNRIARYGVNPLAAFPNNVGEE